MDRQLSSWLHCLLTILWEVLGGGVDGGVDGGGAWSSDALPQKFVLRLEKLCWNSSRI